MLSETGTVASQLSRRRLLKLSAGSLLAAGLWPGTLRADGAGGAGDFRFVALNDLHFVDAKCAEYQQRVIQQIKDSGVKLDFCLLLGDLMNDGGLKELGALKDVYKTLGVPTYEVIGNHDYTAKDDRKAYETLCPDRLNYSFEHQGWQFVGLDSTQSNAYQNTTIQAPATAWLDEALKKLDKKRPTLLFTHFPLGPGVKYRPKNADEVLERFKEFNLQAVLNGHFHGFTEVKSNGVVLTTGKCCSLKRNNHDGTKDKGYYIYHAKDGVLAREFVEFKV